jgi:hypothetical protein
VRAYPPYVTVGLGGVHARAGNPRYRAVEETYSRAGADAGDDFVLALDEACVAIVTDFAKWRARRTTVDISGFLLVPLAARE